MWLVDRERYACRGQQIWGKKNTEEIGNRKKQIVKTQATVLVLFSTEKCTHSECESMRMHWSLPLQCVCEYVREEERDWDAETDLIASQECFWDPTHNQSKEKRAIHYQHPVDFNETQKQTHSFVLSHLASVDRGCWPPAACSCRLRGPAYARHYYYYY